MLLMFMTGMGVNSMIFLVIDIRRLQTKSCSFWQMPVPIDSGLSGLDIQKKERMDSGYVGQEIQG